MHLHYFFQTLHSVLSQIFYRSNWISKVNGRLHFRKSFTHQSTKKLQTESLFHILKKLSKSFVFYCFEPDLEPILRISFKLCTLSFKKDIITAKTESQLKCLKERKKLRATLHMKDLVLHSSAETWDAFSVAKLAMNLEGCWEEKDLTNENLLTVLSAYTLSWITRTWLSTISLVTRKPHCCVVFLPFQSLRAWGLITTGQYMNNQAFSNLQFRPLLKKFCKKFHIDFRDTSGKKIPFSSFGITRLTFNSNSKDVTTWLLQNK